MGDEIKLDDLGSDNPIDNSIDLESQLSLIYGDNVRVLFNQLAFVWDEEFIDSTVNKNKQCEKRAVKNGKLLFGTGEKMVRDNIESVIPLEDGAVRHIVGYAVMFVGDLKSIYKIKTSSEYLNLSVLVVSSDIHFRVGKIKVNYYSKERPEVRLGYNYKTYIGKFDKDNNLESFTSP